MVFFNNGKFELQVLEKMECTESKNDIPVIESNVRPYTRNGS